MKFQLFSIGARFEYEGKAYVKTGPLTATTEDGGQRMIPRSAILTPLDSARVEAPKPGLKVDRTVLEALAVFHAECAHLLQVVADDATQEQTALTKLDTARQRFLTALE